MDGHRHLLKLPLYLPLDGHGAGFLGIVERRAQALQLVTR